MTLSITIDKPTEVALRKLSASVGYDVPVTAARLLAKVVRETAPRPTYDIEAIKAAVAEFEDEELALADSDSEHRLALLEAEDQAWSGARFG